MAAYCAVWGMLGGCRVSHRHHTGREKWRTDTVLRAQRYTDAHPVHGHALTFGKSLVIVSHSLRTATAWSGEVAPVLVLMEEVQCRSMSLRIVAA